MPTLTLLAAMAVAGANAGEASPQVADPSHTVSLSPSQLFGFAETAEREGDPSTAETAYRALASNPSVEIRNEARFRLAQMLVRQRRLTDGATLLRGILDEQPHATRVRVELAGVLALMGDETSARRELRAARAGPLPTEVAQFIDRFSEALRARKPFGGSFQLALASDSNINRATRSDTLGTVIGDFILSDDAKAKSGKGAALDGQVYGRLPLGRRTTLLASLSTSADLYKDKRFNDILVDLKAGPELQFGSTQLNLSAAVRRRSFGGETYSTSLGGQADVTLRIAADAQVRGALSADRLHNHLNDLESGWVVGGSASFEAALSERSGAGIVLGGVRRALRDPGYSTFSGQATLFGYHELGKFTISASGTASRLLADERLMLYPERRKELALRGTLGLVSRHLTVQGFAPTIRLTIERNRSNIELYDYRRTAFELGVTRAF